MDITECAEGYQRQRLPGGGRIRKERGNISGVWSQGLFSIEEQWNGQEELTENYNNK